jgi:hypothetical protein
MVARSLLRFFPIGRNERSMQSDGYHSFQEFLAIMDSGELDGKLTTELKKLSKEQLEQLAQVLMERDTKRSA